MYVFRKNLRIFFGKLRSSKDLAPKPTKIRKFECYPDSLSHYMRAFTARRIAATQSVRLYGKAIHMGARHLLLETASNQLLLQFAKH